MDANEANTEMIATLITAQLRPALELEVKRMEQTLESKQAAFELRISNEQNHHHAENRTRLQNIAELAENNGQMGAETLAKVDIMFGVAGQTGTMGRIESKVDTYQQTVTDMIADVRGFIGERKGNAEAEARYASAVESQQVKAEKRKETRMKFFQWIGGMAVSGGILKWLQNHFHLGK